MVCVCRLGLRSLAVGVGEIWLCVLWPLPSCPLHLLTRSLMTLGQMRLVPLLELKLFRPFLVMLLVDAVRPSLGVRARGRRAACCRAMPPRRLLRWSRR